jgi:hypothetical protein
MLIANLNTLDENQKALLNTLGIRVIDTTEDTGNLSPFARQVKWLTCLRSALDLQNKESCLVLLGEEVSASEIDENEKDLLNEIEENLIPKYLLEDVEIRRGLSD